MRIHDIYAGGFPEHGIPDYSGLDPCSRTEDGCISRRATEKCAA
jgi:hypothetical protein